MVFVGSAMFKILVVEDDKDLNRTVCSFLNYSGYEAIGCLNANDANDALTDNIIDLIVSDIMMPGVNGFEFAENVRELNEDIPILFMTVKDDIASKKRGFRISVDDYMVKPVDFDELFLRIGALLRRAKIVSNRKLEIGKFIMDADEHTAYLNREEISLTNREFSILYKLLSYPKKTFTRMQLMDEFWDADTNTAPRAVDVYMTKLRTKLSDCDDFEIVTVHGLGYKAVLK
jgi:two-component system, OmpR family, response regulator